MNTNTAADLFGRLVRTDVLLLRRGRNDACPVPAKDVQEAFIAHKDLPWKCLLGPRGCGASWAGVADLALRRKPGARYLVLSPTYPRLMHLVDHTMLPCLEKLGVLGSYNKSLLRVICRDGTTIFLHTASPSIHSVNVSGVFMDCAGEIRDDRLTSWLASMLREGGLPGWVTMTQTVPPSLLEPVGRRPVVLGSATGLEALAARLAILGDYARSSNVIE